MNEANCYFLQFKSKLQIKRPPEIFYYDIKGTVMQIWNSPSLYTRVHIDTLSWKLRILIPKNYQVIYP